jgi:hypothetical protein
VSSSPCPDYLRPHEAAEIKFGNAVDGGALLRAIRAKQLKAYNIANKLFTTLEDVDDWVRAHAVAPTKRGSAPVSRVDDTAVREAVARAEAAIANLEQAR